MFWMLAILASAQAPATALEPSSSWTLSSQDDGCTVAQGYSEDHTIQVGFQTTMQTRPAFLLVRAPKKLLPAGIGEAQITLDESKPVSVHYGSFETNEPGVRLVKFFPDEATMTRIAATKAIGIGVHMPTLKIANADEAIKAVDTCTADKLVSWGVDPSIYFQRKTASGNLGLLFDAKDYPKEARDRGISGRVVLLLKTDKIGGITDCKVVASADQSLNVGSCEAAKRGTVKPPVDLAGQPIASYVVVPVVWRHP